MAATEAVQARPVPVGAGTPAAPAAPATFIYADAGGDDYWRAKAPAKVLGAKLVAVPPKQMERAFTRPNSSTPLPWRIELRTPDGQQHTFSTMKAWKQFCKTRPDYVPSTVRSVFPKIEGVAVWQRPDLSRAVLALAMQEQGIRTIGETDDNYFAVANQNVWLRQQRFSETERLSHARAFACHNALVFSTSHLRDSYWRELRSRIGKKNVPELYVCRNHAPLADWPERLERDGPVRVGFMGSPSHVWDLAALAYGAFHAAHSIGCETVFIGYSPTESDMPDEQRSARSLEIGDRWARVISRHVPWVAPAAYTRAALPLDIGIAPLRTNAFNLGKSDVKAIEYAISGTAAVLQNNTVYNSAGWVHEQNCLMASTQEDFAHAVVRLVRDAKLRYELVSNAQAMVMNDRGDEQIREEWHAALAG